MNNLIVIMAGKLNGRIRWDIRKSTKMTIDRYLDMLVKLLANKVDSELQFATLPPSLDLYRGGGGQSDEHHNTHYPDDLTTNLQEDN